MYCADDCACVQGMKVLQKCAWGHMNLKPSKVWVKISADGAYLCTIVACMGRLSNAQRDMSTVQRCDV